MTHSAGIRGRSRLWAPSAALLVSLLLAIACGGGSSDSDAAQVGDQHETSDASNDVAQSDALGTDTIGACYGPDNIYPAFDRSCGVASDCVVAFHTADCCGTLTAMGINTSEQSRFDQIEPLCQAQLPGCGCASNTLNHDDGISTQDKRNDLQVECRNKLCTSFIP